MEQTIQNREPFFTRDRGFYKTLFKMLTLVALQNLIAYSVNMLDNIMLGSYSQDALSGAATVNQIFFLVQQLANGIGNALVVLTSQYWGKQEIRPIRKLTGTALKASVVIGIVSVGLCFCFPRQLLRLFTPSQAIQDQGAAYLSLIQWTFLLFLISNTLLSALRSVKTVHIAFYISVVSLVVNAVINYLLIFGNAGFPEMGVRGAAIGTLVSRLLELAIVLVYMARFDKKIRLFSRDSQAGSFLSGDPSLSSAFRKVAVPIITGSMLWSISVPIQTAILGHLTPDAIAANSVASTFYQYLKVIVVAMASTSSVMIGNAIGAGDKQRIRSDGRTLSVIDLAIGIVLGALLFILRDPLLSLYQLTDTAHTLARNMIAIMSVIMVGMAYHMPVISGIIQGAGDTKFSMITNLVSTWLIVMPLSFLAAFVWKWPVEAIVIVLQSDQVFKSIPAFLRFRSYRWIRDLTK